jgi:hypothetical protein
MGQPGLSFALRFSRIGICKGGALTRPALPDAGSCENVEMSNRTGNPQRDRVVKQCPCCGYAWRTLEALLGDPQLQIVGYQANFADLLLGLFLFNHLGCGSTIAVPAELFKDLYTGPIYSARVTGTADCPEYCLYASELGDVWQDASVPTSGRSFRSFAPGPKRREIPPRDHSRWNLDFVIVLPNGTGGHITDGGPSEEEIPHTFLSFA